MVSISAIGAEMVDELLEAQKNAQSSIAEHKAERIGSLLPKLRRLFTDFDCTTCRGRISLLNNLAGLYHDAGHHAAALSCYRAALNLEGAGELDLYPIYKSLGQYYQFVQDYELSLVYLEKALAAAQSLSEPGDMERRELTAAIGAHYYINLDDREALDYYELLLEECRQNEFLPIEDTSIALQMIGNCHARLGNLTQALDHQLESLETWNSIPTTKDNIQGKWNCCHDFFLTLSALAGIVPPAPHSTTGPTVSTGVTGDEKPPFEIMSPDLERETDAGFYLRKARDIFDEGFFYDPPRYVETALAYGLRALELQIRAVGPDDIRTADYYHEVGICFSELEQWDDALHYYHKALDIREKQPDKDDSSIAVSCYCIADVYMEQKLFLDALPWALREWELRGGREGLNELRFASCCEKVARLYWLTSRYADAITWYRKLWSCYSKAEDISEYSGRINQILAALADCYQKTGDAPRSNEYLLRLIVSNTRQANDDIHLWIHTLHALSVYLSKQGHDLAAIDSIIQAIELRLTSIDDPALDRQRIYCALAVTSFLTGDLSRAAQLRQSCLSASNDSPSGKDMNEVIQLARNNLEHNEPDTAIELCRTALLEHGDALPDGDGPSCLELYRILSEAFAQLGEDEIAIRFDDAAQGLRVAF